MAPRGPRYSEEQARAAIAASLTYTEALRRLGVCHTGRARDVLRRHAEDVWRIDTTHFDPHAARIVRHAPPPLEDVLRTGSTYNRGSLKRRLFEIAASGYLAVARRYGVSDNAIRNWVRAYERERTALESGP